MTQNECRRFIIEALLAEDSAHEAITIPAQSDDQRRLLRALMNVRPAAPLPDDVLQVQDEYLRREIAAKGIHNYLKATAFHPAENFEKLLWCIAVGFFCQFQPQHPRL